MKRRSSGTRGARMTPMAQRQGWRALCEGARACAADARAEANTRFEIGRLERLRVAVVEAKKTPPPLENASEQAVAKGFLAQAEAFAMPATAPERRSAFAELLAAGARCVEGLIEAAAPHPRPRADIDG